MKSIFCLFLLLVVIACTPQVTLPGNVADVAGGNERELQKVLDHYNGDSLKQQAALYLLTNMPGHYTATSELFGTYRKELLRAKTRVPLRTLNQWWKELSTRQEDRRVELADAETLTADFLIGHIDQAFNVWQQSAWSKEVSFSLFCQYILPYRFFDEELKAGSRDSLYCIYHPLIAGVTDMKKAFAILQNHVWHEIGSGSSSISYTPNVLDMRHQQRATCRQRCILLGSVARAVGLPVAIDHVYRWSNYSHTGHSWVSLVACEGTYTVSGRDSIARQGNPIDASSFESNSLVKRDFPIDSRFTKRASKIWRVKFEPQSCLLCSDWDECMTEAFRDSFRMDVSADYGLDGKVEGCVKDSSIHEVCLCTFSTGDDWKPVDYCPVKDGRYVFTHVGTEVAYLLVICDDDITPLEAPFILTKNGKVSLKPDRQKLQRLMLTRKYPLTGNFLNNWSTMVGSRIEGSNYADFHVCDLLSTVNNVPSYENRVHLSNMKSYRFVRFVATGRGKVPLTEFVCTSFGRYLKGKPFCDDARNPQKCFDYDTYTAIGAPKQGYSVGVDLGSSVVVTSITYYLKNDDNYIIPGGKYELYYYDRGWVSLGTQTARNSQLIYSRVPSNALFLLRRLDKGSEERVFTYDNGRQVWW